MALDYVSICVTTWHLLVLFLAEVIHVTCDGPIVKTDKGVIQGLNIFANGKKVDAYYGIPYAAPPIGDLRYKPPVQIDPWDGVYDATKLPNSCIQTMDTFFDNFTGSTMWNANTPQSEDCLYLNVWVPRTNPPFKDKAVIVWIYGGGFYSGSSTLDLYQAQFLAAETDVIVVSMQYRVGSLGFLAFDTAEAPGNAGLWDQRMALEWVSRNIHNFGGSAHNVTLMGESAGAVSVGLFLLCDLCRGYFHKAILQSGAPQAKWAAMPKEIVVERSKRLARSFGCDKENDHNFMVRCLRKVNATEFPYIEPSLARGIIQFPFVPIVDGVFLRQNPQELLAKGIFKKIPLLLGSNENEGTFFIIYTDAIFKREAENPIPPSQYKRLMTNFMFAYYPHYPITFNYFGQNAIMFHYRDWLNPNDPIALGKSIDRAVSDAYFVCPVNELARAYAEEDVPVYYYWFDQRWSANPWPEWMGVLHADELWFTFGHPLNNSLPFTEGERLLSRKMMTYWTNFAKTGDPNQAPGEAPLLEWPRFKENEQLYLNLSVDSFASGKTWGQGPRTQDCAFWDVYLPRLVAETSNISDAEREWKIQFHEWKTRYIVDWKTQFDNFLHNYQRRMGSCSGSRP